MTKNCLIITRPIDDALKTQQLLKEHGLESFIEPVITIEIIDNSKDQLTKLALTSDAIIITSSNALKAIEKFGNLKNSKLIALGASTSSLAKERKFTNVEYGGENIDFLKEYIKLNYSGKNIIYASGNNITEELNIENSGANITRIEVYKTIPQMNLSSEFKEKLKAGDFNGVLFFSKNTASIFSELLRKEGLENHAESLNSFCFSVKIAKLARTYGFKATMYPENANLDAFLKIIMKF